jgi:nitric oxide reductase subunit C
MSRSWIFLFSVFIIYTCSVFYFCGRKPANEASPQQQVLTGWNIWQKNNCQACHQLYGLGGYLGPDLTNIASDPVKNEMYIRTFIKYGASRMPNFNLNDTEISELVTFLKWVDKSGRARVPAERVTQLGNYNLEE